MPTVPKYTQTQTVKETAPLYQTGRGSGDPRAFGYVQGNQGAGLQALGEVAADAYTQIQNRNDATAIARGLTDVRPQMQSLFNAEQTSGSDFSDPKNVTQFTSQLRALAEKAVQNYGGSERGRAKYSTLIEREVQQLLDSGASRGMAANKAKVDAAIGDDIDKFSMGAAQDPSSIIGQLEGVAQHIDEVYGDALSETEQATWVKTAQSQIVNESISTMLMTNNGIEQAADLLNNPTVSGILTPKQRTEIRKRILEADAVRTKAIAEGKGLRSTAAAALDIPEDQVPDSVIIAMLGVKGGADITEVADPTSPTGIRVTTKADAVGKPGVPKKPLVQVGGEGQTSFQKEMGKLEANMVDTLSKASAQAYRDLDEITRMEASMKSGRFKTGSFAEQRVFISRLAEFFDIPMDDQIWQMVGDAATSDTLDAAVANLSVAAAQKIGRQTNMSLKFITDSLPGLSRTPEGNKILIEVMKRSANRQIQLADIANEYARTFNTLNPTEEQWKQKMGNVPYQNFAMAQAELEKRDPVVSKELRNLMSATARKAPKSFKEAVDNSLPTGLPPGSTRTGQTLTTGEEVWVDPQGRKYKVKAQ